MAAAEAGLRQLGFLAAPSEVDRTRWKIAPISRMCHCCHRIPGRGRGLDARGAQVPSFGHRLSAGADAALCCAPGRPAPGAGLRTSHERWIPSPLSSRLLAVLAVSRAFARTQALPAAGVLSAPGTLFFRAEGANEFHKQALCHPAGDIVTAVQAFAAWRRVSDGETKDWCLRHLLVPKVLKAASSFVSSVEATFRKSNLFAEEQRALQSSIGDVKVLQWYDSTDVEIYVEELNRSFVDAYSDNLCAANGPERAGLLLAKDVSGLQEEEDDGFDGLSPDAVVDPCAVCFNSLQAHY